MAKRRGEQQARVDRIDKIVGHEDEGRGQGHVDRRLSGLGGLREDLSLQALELQHRLGDSLDRFVQPAAAFVAGQDRGRKQGEVLASKPLAGLGQRLLQRLSQVVFRDYLVELGVDRLRTLGREDLQRLGQRQARADRAGQGDHGVGKLVFDLLSAALGHPPQEVPGRGDQEGGNQEGKDQAVQPQPEAGQGDGNRHHPRHQVTPQTPRGGAKPAELLGQILLHRVQRLGKVVPASIDQQGHGQAHG